MEKELEVILTWVKNGVLEEIENYVKRGRLFSETDVDVLKNQWVNTFKKWTKEPLDSANKQICDDLGSELKIRKIELPYELVEQDFENYKTWLNAEFENLRRDRQQFTQASLALTEDINSSLKKLSKRPIS